MKKTKAMVWLAWLFFGAAMAQSVNPSHGIGRVDPDHEDSNEYLARTPYTLRWVADAKYKLYGKQNPAVKVESYLAGIHVYDVTSGDLIMRVGQRPLTGTLHVPVSGKHMIKVFCTGPINLSYEEDKAALETSARRGELKDNVTVEAAKAGGMRTKNEKIAEAKTKLLRGLEEKRTEFVGGSLDTLKMHIERAAQVATSEEDFWIRFTALVKLEIPNMNAQSLAALKSALP